MTQNQIAYFSAKENERHNRAMEAINSGTLSETQRHNLDTEQLNWFSARNLKEYQTASSTAALRQAAAAGAQAAAAQTSAAANVMSAKAAQTSAAANWYNAVTTRDTAEGRTAYGAEQVRTQAAIANTKEAEAQMARQEADVKSNYSSLYTSSLVNTWQSPFLENQLTSAKTRNTNSQFRLNEAETSLKKQENLWYPGEAFANIINKEFTGVGSLFRGAGAMQ